MAEYHVTYKTKSKKYTKLVLIIDGQDSCLAEAFRCLSVLTGQNIRQSEIEWADYVKTQKMWRGFDSTCKTYQISQIQAKHLFNFSLILDYVRMYNNDFDKVKTVLTNHYQENSFFMDDLQTMINNNWVIKF